MRRILHFCLTEEEGGLVLPSLAHASVEEDVSFLGGPVVSLPCPGPFILHESFRTELAQPPAHIAEVLVLNRRQLRGCPRPDDQMVEEL